MTPPEPSSWIADPRLARRLARVSWVTLCATFVVLTRFDFGRSVEHAIVAALIAAMGILNLPVVLGLYRSRGLSHTAPFRYVALALGLRLAATAFVVWYLT